MKDSELTVIEDVPSEVATTDLLGASPGARLDEATRISNLLSPIIREKALSVSISGREHVLFEGWTLLGSLLGVFPSTESVVEIAGPSADDAGVYGFEARVVAKTLGGQVVGAAVARCTRGERQWANRDEFALASMAQTRAGAKALRMPLGFVMQLAGYAATPADEMVIADAQVAPSASASAPPSPPPAPAPPSRSGGGRKITEKQQKRLFAITAAAGERIGMTRDGMVAYVQDHLAKMGLESSSELTRQPYDTLCGMLESLTLDEFKAAAADDRESPF